MITVDDAQDHVRQLHQRLSRQFRRAGSVGETEEMTVRQRANRRSVRVFSPFKCAVCDQPERFNMIQFNPMRLYFWSASK